MDYFMGIDAGTSGVKVIVMDREGRTAGKGYCECNVISPFPGYAEQDPREWWEALKQAAVMAVKECGAGEEIRAVSFSGQMQGCTMLDENMEPAGTCMIWLDQRSTEEAAELNSRIDREEMLGITGSSCLPSYWAAKLNWVKKHRPEQYRRIHKVMFAKDYLRYRMTGETAVDVSDASLTFLFDLRTRSWSERMLDVCGIPREILPDRVLESQDIAGYLKSSTAKELGMRPGIPVIAGGGDQPVGGIGCGAVKTGVISAVTGTSGVVFGCCDTPFADKKNRGILSTCHSVPGKYDFLGCTLSAGGSFKWLRDTFFEREKRELLEEKKDVYDWMTGLAEQAPAGSEGLIFLPYLNGESTPIVDADARGVFFGLTLRHGKEAICRSVMEGISFSLRDTIEIFRETGVDVTEVRAMGGGAKSRLWRQIQADIYNARVVTTNMEEGPAAGAAILAAVGAGYYGTIEEACDAVLQVKTVTEPIPEHVRRYERYYQTYRSLYPALSRLYRSQARIVEEDMEMLKE